MNKIYLRKNWTDKYQDVINGRTRVTIGWTVDFTRLPQMRFLLDMLSYVMKEQDWNDVDPTLEYADNDYDSFTFTTTAWVKVKEGDKFNDVIGYQLATTKAEMKATWTYKKLIRTINDKINQYWSTPLNTIEISLYENESKLKKKFDKEVKEFN